MIRTASLLMSVSAALIPSESAAVSAAKKAVIRNHIKDVLKVLSSDQIVEKSDAIFQRLTGMTEFQKSASICLYLSMPAGEVQSYVLLQHAFDNRKRVFIPKVTGKNSENLKIFELDSYAVIDDFPRSKWGIPEPTLEFTDKASDATYLGTLYMIRTASLLMSVSAALIPSESAAVSAAKKAVIRNHIKDVLKVLSSDQIVEKSDAIFQRLTGMTEFQKSASICLYLSMPAGEVQSYVLLQHAFDNRKRVFIPKVTGKNSENLKIFELDSYAVIDDFPRSKWGIPEPTLEFTDKASDATYLGLVDCIIMPGVAFDSLCARVGHGKGYYDCFLERITAANIACGKAPPLTIGLAFDEQILEDYSIPMEIHDKVLDYVLTPTRTFAAVKK